MFFEIYKCESTKGYMVTSDNDEQYFNKPENAIKALLFAIRTFDKNIDEDMLVKLKEGKITKLSIINEYYTNEDEISEKHVEDSKEHNKYVNHWIKKVDE